MTRILLLLFLVVACFGIFELRPKTIPPPIPPMIPARLVQRSLRPVETIDSTGSNLIIRDLAGRIIACGTLRLPDILPPEGEAFSETWTLQAYREEFPADATTDGKYNCTMEEGHFWINLNVGSYDCNVILEATSSEDRFQGVCLMETNPGPEKLGTFTIERTPAK